MHRRFPEFADDKYVVYDTDPLINEPVYGGTFTQCMQLIDEMQVGGCDDYKLCANPIQTDKQIQKPELKPCPFCGRHQGDSVGIVPDADGWAAGCTDNCRIVVQRPTIEQAVDAWNTRS